MPHLFNIHTDYVPSDAVFIGRPTKYGNPFIIGKDGDRDEVIRKYERYINSNPSLRETVQKELRGKNLVCFCSPLKCHGEILLNIANSNIPEILED